MLVEAGSVASLLEAVEARVDPGFGTWNRDFYLNKPLVSGVYFISGSGEPPTKSGGRRLGIENFARTIKQRTCEPAQKRITGTVKGELEAQDKGGPRSQETKTVKDCD